MNYVKIQLAIVAISLVAVLIVCNFATDYVGYIIEEDSLVENLSAAAYFVAFVTGLVVLSVTKSCRIALLMIAMVGLAGFLDEISFGERLFDLDMPRVGGIKTDAFHDFVTVVLVSGRDHPAIWGMIILAAIIVSVPVAIRLKLRDRFRRFFQAIQESAHYMQAFKLVCIFGALLLVAIILDLELIKRPFIYAIEEVFELDAAIALVLCSLSLYGSDRADSAGSSN